jgi:trehalose-6-phosphate synthase
MDCDIITQFVADFCQPLLDPIMNNRIDIYSLKFNQYSVKQWQLFNEVCLNFAKAIIKVNHEYTSIFILDHRILLAVTYINTMVPKTQILLYLNRQFPSLEKLRLLPYYEGYINAILCSDIITFQEFESALYFFQVIYQMFGIKYYSKRGKNK